MTSPGRKDAVIDVREDGQGGFTWAVFADPLMSGSSGSFDDAYDAAFRNLDSFGLEPEYES